MTVSKRFSIENGRLVRAAALVIGAAAVATSIGALILPNVLTIDPTFRPISLPSVIFVTVAYGIAAAVVYRWIVGRSGNPQRAWLLAALAGFLLTLIPDALLLLAPANGPLGTVTPAAVGALVVLHLIAAPIVTFGLLRLAPPTPVVST